MTTISSAGTAPSNGSGILDREHTIAKAGFNRWMVPPAALCIHLCIGMAYGFSVFWLPLSRAVGLTAYGTAGTDKGLELAKREGAQFVWIGRQFGRGERHAKPYQDRVSITRTGVESESC